MGDFRPGEVMEKKERQVYRQIDGDDMHKQR